MQSINQSLRDIFKSRLITYDMALSRASNPGEFRRLTISDLERLKKKRRGILLFRLLKVYFKKLSLLNKLKKSGLYKNQ